VGGIVSARAIDSELTNGVSWRDRVRPWVVSTIVVLALLAVVAARMAPTALERCVDQGAPSWNGTPSELWAECSEQVTP